MKKMFLILLLISIFSNAFTWKGKDLKKLQKEQGCPNGNFTKINLSTRNLDNTLLCNSDFSHTNLKKTSFKNADLQGVKFNCADLSQADFAGANLENAIFFMANLEGVNFQNANLKGANFQRANLKNANIKNACLYSADLRAADMIDVQFDFSIFKSIDKETRYSSSTKTIFTLGHVLNDGACLWNDQIFYTDL